MFCFTDESIKAHRFLFFFPKIVQLHVNPEKTGTRNQPLYEQNSLLTAHTAFNTGSGI